MARFVYLDSAVLVPLTVDADMPDEETWARGIVGKLESQSNSHDIYVKIPQVCIGETVSRYRELHTDGGLKPGSSPPRDTFLDSLFSILDKVDGELTSTNTDAQKVATRLERQNNRICNHDALIVATAIVDNESTHLITTDDTLIDSPHIRELSHQREQRQYSLTVTDSY
jgi:hypothetical protein